MEAIKPNSPFGRTLRFLDVFLALPPTAEIEIRSGHEETTGEGAIGIFINGQMHGFTLNEARELADLLEATGKQFPKEAKGYANTIMAIRECVKRGAPPPPNPQGR